MKRTHKAYASSIICRLMFTPEADAVGMKYSRDWRKVDCKDCVRKGNYKPKGKKK